MVIMKYDIYCLGMNGNHEIWYLLFRHVRMVIMQYDIYCLGMNGNHQNVSKPAPKVSPPSNPYKRGMLIISNILQNDDKWIVNGAMIHKQILVVLMLMNIVAHRDKSAVR